VKTLAYLRGAPIDETATTRRGTVIREGAVPAGKPATLSPRPKLLSQLWDEWMKGIDGRLPAKDFTSMQRGAGKIKHVFCLRKPFWLCVERLIDAGYTSSEAIQLIDEIYPGSMTQKLRAIKKHESLGGHWKLCPQGRGVGRPSDD